MNERLRYNKKFYKTIFGKIYIRITNKIVILHDNLVDLFICKRCLGKRVPSLDNEKYTDCQATMYWALEQLFENTKFTPNDKIIDVGCGKGRVIAYLLKSKFSGKITGVELNPEVAKICSEWTNKYDNIEVLNKNVFDIDLNQYNVQYLFRPFQPQIFESYINKIENELDHPMTLYFLSDMKSTSCLQDRANWTLLKRKWIFTKHLLCLVYSPQRFSIWLYDPSQKQ